jgi:hypothetical protein
MSYIVNWSKTGVPPNGKPEIIVNPREIDTTSTSLVLTGFGLPNYGEIQQENFIRLLENFASDVSPPNPTHGQIWFKTDDRAIFFYDINDTWKRVGGIFKQDEAPSEAEAGDLWWDTNDVKLFVFSGTEWGQIWPTVDEIRVAYVEEYNQWVDRYNRIAGTPTTNNAGGNDIMLDGLILSNGKIVHTYEPFSSVIPSVTYGNKYGYGQNHLTHKAVGELTNQDWIDILEKFRRLASHQGTNASALSTRGFIIEPEAAVGIATIENEYDRSVRVLNDIELNRFNALPLSLESSVLTNSTHVRTEAYYNVKHHEVAFTFDSANHAKAFFNAGGKFRITRSFSPSQVTPFNSEWQALLTAIGNISFSVSGVSHSTNPNDIGFYDLTTSYETLFLLASSTGVSAGAYYKIEACIENAGAVIRFRISFAPDGIESIYSGYSNGDISQFTAIGATNSTITAFKPTSSNLNSPVISYPSATQSGSFINDPTV